MDDEYFTTPYVTDTIPNSQSGHQIPTQDKKLLWIISINGEEPITDQGAIDELNFRQTSCGKSKVNISLFRKKICHRIDLEEIRSRFDQVRPVFSHMEFRLP